MGNDMYICKNHATAINYRGKECPWCSFAAEMVRKLKSEYERGFVDGVAAADIEYAKQEAARLAEVAKKMEVKSEEVKP